MQNKLLILLASLFFSFSSFNNSSIENESRNQASLKKDCNNYLVTYYNADLDATMIYPFDTIDLANGYSVLLIHQGYSPSIQYNPCDPDDVWLQDV